MMVRMVSKAAHEYAQRKYEAGDEFDCEPEHIAVLTMLGRAEVIQSSDNQKRKYQKRVAA